MRKFTRLPTPQYLAENWIDWGEHWERARINSSGAAFNWRQINGFPVNQLLMPILKSQTQDHCSFCDHFPVSPPSLNTIEHFKPKSLFPKEAFRWENLYYCCMNCQSKGNKFDELTLCPDDINYEFSRYFQWDYTLGILEVNTNATEDDKLRAARTIEIYKLNDEHPRLRRRELQLRSRAQDLPLDSFAYRDYVE